MTTLVCMILVTFNVDFGNGKAVPFMSKAQVEGVLLSEEGSMYLGDFSKEAKKNNYLGDYSKVLVETKSCIKVKGK